MKQQLRIKQGLQITVTADIAPLVEPITVSSFDVDDLRATVKSSGTTVAQIEWTLPEQYTRIVDMQNEGLKMVAQQQPDLTNDIHVKTLYDKELVVLKNRRGIIFILWQD